MPYQLLVTGASGKNVVAATPAATSNSGLPLQVEWEIELEARRTATDWPVATLNTIDAANLLFIRSGTDFEFRSSGNSNWLVTTGLTLTNFNTFRIRTTFDGTTRTQQLFLNGSTTPFATRTPTTANFSGFGALFTLASDSSRSGEFRYLKWTDFVTPANNRVWDARVSNGSQTVLNETVTNATASLSNLNYSWVFYSSGGTYTLSADGATFSYTGAAANTLFNRQLPSDGATYSYSGGIASTLYNRRLSSDGAVYAYSGGIASTLYNRKLSADGGTYIYSGAAATLTYTAAGVVYTLNADGGVFGYTGVAAQLLANRALSADGGSFTYSGGAAEFDFNGYPQADANAFVVSYRIAGDTVLTASISESTRFSAIISQSTNIRYMVN
jgi:hypothetical protein